MDTDVLVQLFRDAFRNHPTGVAVLTANGVNGALAMTVGSLISVSANPPVVGFSLSSKAPSAAGILQAGSLVVHLLRQKDRELARLGATPGADRFGADVRWERLPTGEPRYLEVATWFRANIIGTLPLQEATLVAAQLLEGQCDKRHEDATSAPLVYLDRRWRRLHAEKWRPFSFQAASAGLDEHLWY